MQFIITPHHNPLYGMNYSSLLLVCGINVIQNYLSVVYTIILLTNFNYVSIF